MKTTGYIVAFVVVVFVLGLGGLGWYAFFAPKYNAVDNQVFHQSQQYTDGMKLRLSDFEQAYYDKGATVQQRAAIQSEVKHEYASFDESGLNPDLLSFLRTMKGQAP